MYTLYYCAAKAQKCIHCCWGSHTCYICANWGKNISHLKFQEWECRVWKGGIHPLSCSADQPGWVGVMLEPPGAGEGWWVPPSMCPAGSGRGIPLTGNPTVLLHLKGRFFPALKHPCSRSWSKTCFPCSVKAVRFLNHFPAAFNLNRLHFGELQRTSLLSEQKIKFFDVMLLH